MAKNIWMKFLLAAAFSVAASGLVYAETISTSTYLFQSLDNLALNGTGLGNYNVILFENAGGGSGNDGGSVNVDNANTLLPTGSTSTSGSLYWMTSVGDLRAFYDQQFGSGNINNLVLFLDINETGNPNETVTITALNIYLNSTTTPTALDPTGSNDLTSAQQEGITGQTSGTLLTYLSPSSQILGQKTTGQGIDDWSIFTFIDPFDPNLSPSDTLLFNFSLSGLAAGGEVLSISGTFSPCDITPQGCGTSSGTSTTGDSTGSTTTGDSTGSTTTSGTSSTGTGTTGVTSGSSTGESSGTTGDTRVPEPAAFLLLGAGLAAVARIGLRKRD